MLFDLRPAFAYAFPVPDDPRQKNALLIAASLIAAVRTAREADGQGRGDQAESASHLQSG